MESMITLDDKGVTRHLATGQDERVLWKDLAEVQIVTTGEGPYVDDVFFLLVGRDGSGCSVPQSEPVSDQLLERLQKLPGFDNRKVIEAMSHMGDGKFLCWKAPAKR